MEGGERAGGGGGDCQRDGLFEDGGADECRRALEDIVGEDCAGGGGCWGLLATGQ